MKLATMIKCLENFILFGEL